MDVKKAINILDTTIDGIPFPAIKFLHNAEDSLINQKIIEALQYANDEDRYYVIESDCYRYTSLWYMIVAENHLRPELIDSVIDLFTGSIDTDDYINEQGMYLLGKLAVKYPTETIEKTMNMIDKLINQKSMAPFLYLFDILHFVDLKKYKDLLLSWLTFDNNWLFAYAVDLSDQQLLEALPIMVSLRQQTNNEMIGRELDYAIKQLETGVIEYPDMVRPYCQDREDWYKYYKKHEHRFALDYDEDKEYEDDNIDFEQISQAVKKIKTGRNQPCPCGSGKKYKKCCLE
jgi:hypothetical protein